MIPKCKEEKNIYSTDEQVVGKWIDGKPLYRKVIENIDILSKTVAHYTYIDLPQNINNIFVKYATVLVNNNNLLLPFLSDTGDFIRINSVTTSQIMIHNNTTYSGTAKLIIEYTKTTD